MQNVILRLKFQQSTTMIVPTVTVLEDVKKASVNFLTTWYLTFL